MSDDMEATILDMITKLGGIEKFQSNPFAFVGEVFKHPELLSQIDKLSKTPEMQKQIAESMNNPMFQQIVGNNPLLSGMMNDYKNFQANSAHDGDDDIMDDDDDMADEDGIPVEGYDISIPGWKAIDFLNPVSNQPFYIPENPDERVKFADILEDLPEQCREPVEIIAEKRLQMHMSPAAMGQLESMAEKYQLQPLDLMMTQGAFAGEVAYCASLVMTDTEDDLCDLVKFALSSLHRRSGYPVASYLVQNLLYLDSFDDIEKEDWENFVWSLSANPTSGKDGNFAVSWDDVMLIAEIAAESESVEQPELFLGICLGLLGWNQLDLKNNQNPLQNMLQNYHDQDAIRDLLIEALGGKKIYAMSLLNIRHEIRADALQFIISKGGLNDLLDKAKSWDDHCVVSASMLIGKLDLLWSKADPEKRDAFIRHAIAMNNEPVAHAALRVGVAWEPETYRLIALDSPYPNIRSWAESLNKA